MEKLPNLPVGQQYFKSIIKGKAIYVDKTEYIYDLLVVLIEGYDVPITDAVDPIIAEQNRQILKYFFSPLKMASNRIRFLLITGVYPLLSPELNHLYNITDDIHFYDIVA